MYVIIKFLKHLFAKCKLTPNISNECQINAKH